MKTYRVLPNRNDPMVSLKMSAEMLDDLSLAAKKKWPFPQSRAVSALSCHHEENP
jgi:hypothetical protein